MKSADKNKQILYAEIIIVVCIIVLILLPQLIGKKSAMVYEGISDVSYNTIADLNGLSVSLTVGSITDDIVAKQMPDSKVLYYAYHSECALAVLTGKVDMTFVFDAQVNEVVEQYEELVALRDVVYYSDTAFVTSKNKKGQALADEFNAFFEVISADGRHDEIYDRWYGGDEIMPDYSYSGEKGKLSVVIGSDYYPQTFIKDGKMVGYSYELACAFCAYAGYTPEFEDIMFDSALLGMAIGKYDLMAMQVTVTDERMESVNFTHPMLVEKVSVIMRGDRVPQGTPILTWDEESGITEAVAGVSSSKAVQKSKAEAFFSGLVKSFEKNFIRENRWQLMLSGLGVTLLLAVVSALLGTLFGSLICFMRMSKNAFLTGFARIYIKLFQGMPIVVLLLVLYYIIFGKTSISALIVCMIGFSFDFSAYVCEIIRTGIEAIPDGQRKAAYALGFSKTRAFVKVVLPQAMRHILPVYRGQFVSMVKMTSIAGYISVQDLTKVSDLIRSRTYEAFFPLITTAIIYFLLTAILVRVLKMFENKGTRGIV